MLRGMPQSGNRSPRASVQGGIPHNFMNPRHLLGSIAIGAALLSSACATATSSSSPESSPSPTASPAASATTTPDPTEFWTSVSNAEGKFSFRYPDTLKVTYNCQNQVWLDLSSASAQTPCPLLGDTGELLFFFASVPGDQRSRLGSNDGSFPGEGTAPLDARAPVTVDGVSGMRYKGAWSSGGMGVVAGERQIVYIFFANDRSYAAIYSQNEGTPDLSNDFTVMVEHTLKFSS